MKQKHGPTTKTNKQTKKAKKKLVAFRLADSYEISRPSPMTISKCKCLLNYWIKKGVPTKILTINSIVLCFPSFLPQPIDRYMCWLPRRNWSTLNWTILWNKFGFGRWNFFKMDSSTRIWIGHIRISSWIQEVKFDWHAQKKERQENPKIYHLHYDWQFGFYHPWCGYKGRWQCNNHCQDTRRKRWPSTNQSGNDQSLYWFCCFDLLLAVLWISHQRCYL